MAQWSFPFPDVNGDREYSDDDFALFYDHLFTNGVFLTVGNALQVTAASSASMNVIVKNGAAIINGRQYFNSDVLAIEVPIASSTQNRVDSVVLRMDITARQITLAYKQASVSVERTSEIWELQLATISVPANSVSVSGSQITDKRSDESVCGYSSPYEKVSVSGLEQQYQAMLQQIFETFESDAATNQSNLEQLLTDQQALFQNWLSNLQNQLDENQAGNLQNQIDKLTANNEIIEIDHDLGRYPNVQGLYWEYGLGTVPLEEQPEGISWDGTSPETIDFKAYHDSSKSVRIHVPINYAMTSPVVTELAENEYLLVDGVRSLQINLV